MLSVITPLDGVTIIKLNETTFKLFLSGSNPVKHEFPIYNLEPRIQYQGITPQLWHHHAGDFMDFPIKDSSL